MTRGYFNEKKSFKFIIISHWLHKRIITNSLHSWVKYYGMTSCHFRTTKYTECTYIVDLRFQKKFNYMVLIHQGKKVAEKHII